MISQIRTYSDNYDLVKTRRDEIARKSVEIFMKNGYEETSVRDIARACGMSIGQLYHYIGSREDVLYLTLQYTNSRIIEFVQNISVKFDSVSPTRALQQAIDFYYRGVDSIQDIVIFMYQHTNNLRPAERKQVFKYNEPLVGVFEKILSRGCESGEFNIEDVGLVAHNIVTSGDMWALRRWYLKKRYTLGEYIKSQMALVMNQINAKNLNNKKNRRLVKNHHYPER
jgi:AcrR family transcriptional regulator